MLFFIAILAFCFTFLGGFFALRFKDKLHLILGFSAGAVLGVAFFDLLPEALALGGKTYDATFITTITAIAFVCYMILDRYFSMRCHNDAGENCGNENHRGKLGAGTLSFHSFLDGVGIGLAFQVSPAVGVVVAVAVLVHDFSDGVNTVNMILKNGGDKKLATKWLIADAIAPVLGVAVTLFFSLSESALGIVLSAFAGFFFYIGASDLLPESHHNHPTKWTTIATILGIAVLYVAIKLANM